MVTLEKSIEYTYRNYEYVLNYSKHNVLSGYSYEAFENSINVLCRD